MLLGSLVIYSQKPIYQGEDPWIHLRFFEGKWSGPATGTPGKGISSRQYAFDLNGRFLTARNRSVYELKTPTAPPEVHEDSAIFSYDRSRKTIVLRQFHSEGFVNEYTLSAVRDNGRELEFVTVRIENIPPGWKAKEVYSVVSPDEVFETFSLAAPGKEFEVYSTAHLRRLKK